MALKWTSKETVESVLTTELNSLGDGSNKITSSALSNDGASERHLYADFRLDLATQGAARDTGAYVALYILPEVDGDYPYGGDSTDPSGNNLVGSFQFDAATTARKDVIRKVELPPSDFYVLVMNETGEAFASAGNILEMERYSIEDA